MYDRYWYGALRRQVTQLDVNNELREQHTLLLQVELGLYLLEQLGLGREPAQVLWLVLSGLPFPSLVLDDQQQSCRARARIYLSYYSGRLAWEAALRDYRAIPVRWRAYTFTRRRAQRTGNHTGRFDVYARTLATPVARQIQSLRLAQDGDVVEFVASLRGRTQKVRFPIPAEIGALGTARLPWPTATRQRQPFVITYQDLIAAAAAMDQQEAQAASRLRGATSDWTARIAALRLRPRRADGTLGAVNSAPLRLEGLVHLAGMVSSGKTNLMKVLAYHLAQGGYRVTLVVGDTMTALELADYYNRLLCVPGAQPIAVPLIGQTTKNSHLQRLYASQSFQQYPDHWGLRWLSTDCPLLSLTPQQLPEPVIPGNEPCQTLDLIPPGEEDAEKSRPKRACPVFAVCPAKQLFRDVPEARIWITTPGALGAGNVPAQVGTERMKYWELVYEQSDLVVFDEVDAIQAWFYQICAPQVTLADGTGLLDRIDPNVATTWARRRALPRQRLRWVNTARIATSAMGLALSELYLSTVLEKWVERKYFTAQSLFLALTYRLFNVARTATTPEENEEGVWLLGVPARLRQSFKRVLGYFVALIESNLTPSRLAKTKQGQAISGLAVMVESIILTGAVDFAACRIWLQTFVPGLSTRLGQPPVASLGRRSRRSPDIPETLETLGERLGLALCVAILDRDMRHMFDEWQNSVVSEQDEERLKRAPADLNGILPVPPTGRLFGFSHHILPRPETPLAILTPIEVKR